MPSLISVNEFIVQHRTFKQEEFKYCSLRATLPAKPVPYQLLRPPGAATHPNALLRTYQYINSHYSQENRCV